MKGHFLIPEAGSLEVEPGGFELHGAAEEGGYHPTRRRVAEDNSRRWDQCHGVGVRAGFRRV